MRELTVDSTLQADCTDKKCLNKYLKLYLDCKDVSQSEYEKSD